MTLEGMTQARWDAMTKAERIAACDPSGLTPQLVGLEGKRVEVCDNYGERRRFWVGRSGGWRPCHIEVKTRRSFGGMAADSHYREVLIVDHGPR